MIQLHPKFLKRDGKEQFAVLPFEEFLAIQEILEDLEDYRLIEEARAADKVSQAFLSKKPSVA